MFPDPEPAEEITDDMYEQAIEKMRKQSNHMAEYPEPEGKEPDDDAPLTWVHWQQRNQRWLADIIAAGPQDAPF